MRANLIVHCLDIRNLKNSVFFEYFSGKGNMFVAKICAELVGLANLRAWNVNFEADVAAESGV